MERPQQFLCKNREGNCPNYVSSCVVTVGGTEKFVCPLGAPNCEREHLEPARPPEPAWLRYLKRSLVIVIPLMLAGAVWLYVVTRPAPPYVFDITYTSPLSASTHPGHSISWTFSVEGGRSSDQIDVAAESLSPSLLPAANIHVDAENAGSRQYKLTALFDGSSVGSGSIKVGLSVGHKTVDETNLSFSVLVYGPPVLRLNSSNPLKLDGDQNTMALPFAVSDDKIDADKLLFSADINPSGIVTSAVQESGANRTVTLSRIGRESGSVQLSVHLTTPDGRETNQTYQVSVVALPPPILNFRVISVTPSSQSVQTGDQMVWTFSVDGGPAGEKPQVTASSLTPDLLPAQSLFLASTDQNGNDYQLTAGPVGQATGQVQVKVSASLDGAIQELPLSFTIASPPPPTETLDQLLAKAFKARHEGRYADALDCANQALKLDGQSMRAWTMKTVVYYSWGRYQDALNTANQALAINSQYSDIWFSKAACEERLGQKSPALKSYQNFINLCPTGDPRKTDAQNRINSLQTQLSQ